MAATVSTSNHGYLNDNYQWSLDGNVKTPLLKRTDYDSGLFRPTAGWVAEFAIANRSVVIQGITSKVTSTIAAPIHAIERLTGFDQKAEVRTLGDYFDALVDNKKNVPTCRDIDAKKEIFISEKAFAEYRLSGPNPLSIRLASADDLINLVPELKDDKEIKALVGANQLFIVDYSQFAKLSKGKSFVDGLSKANFGSVGIFKQEDDGLATVGIKLISPTVNSKLLRPEVGLRWEIAKCVFNSIDTFHNQALVHFAKTHRVAEIFLVATYRRFREDHPLFKLLTPHCEGTLFINQVAENNLVNDGGTFDKLTSYDLEETKDLIKDFLKDFTSLDLRFPERIKAHRMDSETVPGLSYAFRDDGMLTWDAIRKWVERYVRVFYQNDDAVARDLSVTNWIEELRENGGIKWLNGFKSTIDWLSDVIASFICLASVDHSAVNYTQRAYTQYAPSFSMGIYTGDSVFFKNDPTFEDYMSVMPPKTMARAQAESNYVLSSFVYTRLGHYNSQVPWYSFSDYFSGIEGDQWLQVPDNYLNRVNAALLAFQEELDVITTEIRKRNEKRTFPYIVLSPDNLPQSINL